MLTRNLQEAARQYCREVETLLVCSSKTKRAFMGELRSDVQAYITENGEDVSADEIRAYFGTPEDISNSFLDTLSSKAVKRAINWKKVLWVGVGIVLLISVLYMVIALIDGHLAATGEVGGFLIDHAM